MSSDITRRTFVKITIGDSRVICCFCADPQAVQMGSYSRRAYYVHGSGQVWRRRYSNVVVDILTELLLGLVCYAAVIWAVT